MSLEITPGEIASEIWGARTEVEVNYVVLPASSEPYEDSESEDE